MRKKTRIIFWRVKQCIDNFKTSLLIPNEKDNVDSLFCAMCYAARYEKCQKVDKYLDKDSKKDLPNDSFDQLNARRNNLVLDFDYQPFAKQSFLINKRSMKDFF